MISYQVITEIHLNVYQVTNYYRGIDRTVDIQYANNKTISLPFNALLPFVGHEGIHGTFSLKLQNSGELEDGTEIVKLIDIAKVPDPTNSQKVRNR